MLYGAFAFLDRTFSLDKLNYPMRNFKWITLVLVNSMVCQLFGGIDSDTSLRFWTKLGGNSSVHFFNSTPNSYKSENLFSSGYEISTGYKNTLLSLSIGYRNHLFRFQQFNSDFDAYNGYGNYEVYDYQIESIPIKCQLNSQHQKNSLGFNFGFSFSREYFKKVEVVTQSVGAKTYSPRSTTTNETFYLTSGLSFERQINKRITAGISMEALYDVNNPNKYEYPSQMQTRQIQGWLNPFSFTPTSFWGSIYLMYYFK